MVNEKLEACVREAFEALELKLLGLMTRGGLFRLGGVRVGMMKKVMVI